jgi:ABC-type phosphate transport system substrate-binding protein
MKYSSSFTYDLHIGTLTEDWANDLFNGKIKAEVKVDSMAHRTGNVFIEVFSRGKASGISTTTAEFWVYKIEASGSAIIVPVEKLKSLVRKYHAINGFKEGGDENTSKGVLVPIIEFLYGD